MVLQLLFKGIRLDFLLMIFHFQNKSITKYQELKMEKYSLNIFPAIAVYM